ncbi:MAG: NAD-binding protein [Desulfofustis sp.]|jgi:voltage-gated potassium channel|nr:NAD-binding protein [Desulfofustis sp.]
MKFLVTQLLYFTRHKTTRRNFLTLWKFFAFLLLIICLYSVLFHVLMMYENRYYSWVTGFYWTMTVMSTLGFGDITFHTDLGLLFTMLVLISGVLFLLIILPFTFIQFFYAPWLEAQEKARTPRRLPDSTQGHVIITSIDPISTRLIEYLTRQGIPYYVVTGDPQEASSLLDKGYHVVVGEPDRPETYRHIQADKAALVVVTNDDLKSTNISFTIRQVSEDVPIVTNANHEHSIDILEFSGNVSVYEFMKMLGESLSRRAYGVDQSANIIGRFDDLLISELPVRYTELEGKTLADAGIRQSTGVTVIGMMESGRFSAPSPRTVITPSTILMLAGSASQLSRFVDTFPLTYTQDPDKPQVLILGGGRVGQVAARTLETYGISYRIVEKRAIKASGRAGEYTTIGDAADINTLKDAGIDHAKSVIVTTHSDDMNIYLSFYCRQLRPDIQIISRSILERNVSKLHMAGADQVMSYSSLGAGTIFQLLRPNEVSLFTEGLIVMNRRAGSDLSGKTIMQSGIREQTGFSIIAIRRHGRLAISPEPGTVIGEDDELIVIGTAENEKLFASL